MTSLPPGTSAQPLGLLVGVGMTADVDEQGGVVDDRSLLLVEPDSLRQAQRDQALACSIGCPETEVDTERKRSHELRQPNVRAIGPVESR